VYVCILIVPKILTEEMPVMDLKNKQHFHSNPSSRPRALHKLAVLPLSKFLLHRRRINNTDGGNLDANAIFIVIKNGIYILRKQRRPSAKKERGAKEISIPIFVCRYARWQRITASRPERAIKIEFGVNGL
jgi:hypothetical protein